MVPLGKILYATDFSEEAEAAFQYALYLTKLQRGKLFILHVLTRDVSPVYLIPAIETGPMPDMDLTMAHPGDEGYEQEIKQKMFELVQRSRREGLVVEDLVARGKPIQEILRVSVERQIDLIVLGSREKSDLEWILRGNISEKVTRKALCPVLVIRSLPSETGSSPRINQGAAERDKE
jgi:universal stress protein A